MAEQQELATTARAIIDASLYMVLGTADETGRPWVTPVYYASATYREFLWLSEPHATHSLNIGMRREVSIVIFDSSVPIDTGQGVYMSATAEELTGDELAEAIELYSQRSLTHGGRRWTLETVRSPARLRLYRAVAAQQWALDEHDERVPVTL